MRKPKVGGPPAGEAFCWYTREMLLAPAFSEASINCRRLINALEVENMNHAGTENGNLLMPYNQLQRWWHIPRRLIRQTIDEAIERGLIEERRSGWRLSYAKSMPNTFRLTFRPTREGTPRNGSRRQMNGGDIEVPKTNRTAQIWHRVSATK